MATLHRIDGAQIDLEVQEHPQAGRIVMIGFTTPNFRSMPPQVAQGLVQAGLGDTYQVAFDRISWAMLRRDVERALGIEAEDEQPEPAPVIHRV